MSCFSISFFYCSLSLQEPRDERELLSESVRLALEKEREIQELRDQVILKQNKLVLFHSRKTFANF